MSFLLSQGHVEAHQYPLASLWTEVEIARKRINRDFATQTLLFQNAVGALFDKDAAKHFKTIIEGLTDG